MIGLEYIEIRAYVKHAGWYVDRAESRRRDEASQHLEPGFIDFIATLIHQRLTHSWTHIVLLHQP